MSPSLDLLLSHYRQELAEVVRRIGPDASTPCPEGEELLWADVGEGEGWLSVEGAMQVRRLAVRVRYYEGRAQGR